MISSITALWFLNKFVCDWYVSLLNVCSAGHFLFVWSYGIVHERSRHFNCYAKGKLSHKPPPHQVNKILFTLFKSHILKNKSIFTSLQVKENLSIKIKDKWWSCFVFKQRGINLACVRTCCVIAEERPRIQLTTSFTKLFANLGLTPRSVSTSFGCRVNLGMALQVRFFFRESIYFGCFTKKIFWNILLKVF